MVLLDDVVLRPVLSEQFCAAGALQAWRCAFDVYTRFHVPSHFTPSGSKQRNSCCSGYTIRSSLGANPEEPGKPCKLTSAGGHASDMRENTF